MTRQFERTHLETPIGTLAIVAEDDAVVAVMFDIDNELGGETAHNPAEPMVSSATVIDVATDASPVLAAAVKQLTEYFDGTRRDFDLPLAPTGTSFQRTAWNALQTIPYGTTINYGQQAAQMGQPSAARAVGAANGKNPIAIIVPCHRVVGANGSLTGYAGGVGVKSWLLAHERASLPIG